MERLYSFAEAAELLNISVSTLRKKVAAGAVPHRRVFRHIRFSSADLELIQEVRGPRPYRTGTARRRSRAR
jgi:excisionase family DNA binding protein